LQDLQALLKVTAATVVEHFVQRSGVIKATVALKAPRLQVVALLQKAVAIHNAGQVLGSPFSALYTDDTASLAMQFSGQGTDYLKELTSVRRAVCWCQWKVCFSLGGSTHMLIIVLLWV
jgi:hypothetical protein